jgi:phospholipase/carboxylesterase
MSRPDAVEVETGGNITRSVIWLHGLGADGHDFEPIVPELALGDAGIRFVFPHAPVRPVTINGGMPMRAWYDIVSLDRSRPQDEQGIRASAGQLVELIEREHARGVAYERIVVAGFSQGGAIALHAGTRSRQRLAGIIALSTWLPLAATFEPEVVADRAVPAADVPVFMAHGSFDPTVPIAFGRASAETLSAAGFPVEWHEYPMGHAVCPDEIADIRRWLRQTLDR